MRKIDIMPWLVAGVNFGVLLLVTSFSESTKYLSLAIIAMVALNILNSAYLQERLNKHQKALEWFQDHVRVEPKEVTKKRME